MILQLAKKHKKQIFMFFIALIVICFWFYIKLVNFEICHYGGDLFSTVQIGNSWMHGKPLLYENAAGYHARIHNYYFTLLTGVFTYFWGAYGLFVWYFIFMLLGAYFIIMLFSKVSHPENKKLFFLILIVFYLGPSAFLICDAPDYGFHIELMYLQLAIFFAFFLITGKKTGIIISALLIIAMKEDGAVLGAVVHLSWLVMNQEKISLRHGRNFWMRALKISALWSVIFIAGLLFLYYKNDFGETRASKVISKLDLVSLQEWKGFYSVILKAYFIELIPVVLFLIAFINPNKIPWFFLFLLPVFIVELYAGSFYYPYSNYALIWAPRFAVTWGYVISFFLMAANTGNLNNAFKIKYSPPLFFVIGVILFFLQKEGIIDYQKNYIHLTIDKKNFENDIDLQKVKKAIKTLPKDYEVECQHEYVDLFPYNDLIMAERIQYRLKIPNIILCEAGRVNEVMKEKFAQSYKEYELGRFRIFIRPGLNYHIDQ